MHGSVETHSSIVRAVEVLGIGSQGFVVSPTDPRHEVDVAALRAAIRADRERGLEPIAVVGNAGTVNTGATDDLTALADLCAEEELWLHVDGAFGALAALSPELAPRLAGIERADSIAFDLHKWMHVPYAVGVVMFRDGARPAQSFAMDADYISRIDSGLVTGPENFMQLSPQMSRDARALKVWMTIREHGFDKLGRSVLANVHQAQHLAQRCDREPDIERLGPAPLNIVCFRYVGDLPADELDSRNAEILSSLHRDGVAAPSHTRIDGKFAIRVAITNHRTREGDLDLLVDEVLARGRTWRT